MNRPAGRAKHLRLVDSKHRVFERQLVRTATDVAECNRIAVDPQRVGARLRHARKAARLFQADVAERSGLKRENVSRAERGHCSQTLDVIARIATACGVSVAAVLAVENPEEP